MNQVVLIGKIEDIKDNELLISTEETSLLDDELKKIKVNHRIGLRTTKLKEYSKSLKILDSVAIEGYLNEFVIATNLLKL